MGVLKDSVPNASDCMQVIGRLWQERKNQSLVKVNLQSTSPSQTPPPTEVIDLTDETDNATSPVESVTFFHSNPPPPPPPPENSNFSPFHQTKNQLPLLKNHNISVELVESLAYNVFLNHRSQECRLKFRMEWNDAHRLLKNELIVKLTRSMAKSNRFLGSFQEIIKTRYVRISSFF